MARPPPVQAYRQSNPHTQSLPALPIRTPEELAAVNQFLLALGRNVANPSVPLSSYPAPGNTLTELQDYFAPSALHGLGLANMPGLADNMSAQYDPYSVPHHHQTSNHNMHGNMYHHHMSHGGSAYNTYKQHPATGSPPLQKGSGSQSPLSATSADGTPSVSPLPDQQRSSNRYVFNDWNNTQQRYQQSYSAPIQVCTLISLYFNTVAELFLGLVSPRSKSRTCHPSAWLA